MTSYMVIKNPASSPALQSALGKKNKVSAKRRLGGASFGVPILHRNKGGMKASIFTLVLVLGLAFGKDLCKEELRTDVQGKALVENGILVTEIDSYPAGTFWKDEADGRWWVCPCLLAPCIRICDEEFAEEVIEALRKYGPVSHSWWDDIIETDTPPIESFEQIHNAKCDGDSDILYKEDVRILANGKMKLGNKSKLYGAENYCVHEMEGIKNSIHLVVCLPNQYNNGFEEEQYTSVEYHIDTHILLLSSIFLILTVVAYTLSPQIESFHRKSVIFYAAYHAAAFFTVTLNRYFSWEKKLCFLIGFIILYSDLAAMFWLNSMCIDIFFAYKGVIRTGRNYFAKFVAYSTGLPFLIVTVALIFNLINDENSIFNPNVGKLCYVEGKAPAWIYGFGPSLILLLANVGLLSATCTSGESVRTTEETNQTVPQEKERRKKYLILTLMESCTLINEAIPNIYVGGAYINTVVNFFIFWQGVLVFLLLVCADKYVRKSFCSRFCCKGQRAQII